MRGRLLCLLAVLPALASANATYSDAASPWEAVIMLSMSEASNLSLLAECSARLPQLAAGLEDQLATWTADSATALAAARARADTLVGSDAQQMANMRLTARQAATSAVTGAFAANAGESYCVQHFGDLASGIWRQRTPQLYAFLEDPSAMP